MNKYNWKFCGRFVRSVPVRGVFRRGSISGEKALPSEGKEGEESCKTCSVELKAQGEHLHVR